MTASAIGDNLSKKRFEHFGKTKPKLLVQRGLTPRDVEFNCIEYIGTCYSTKTICLDRNAKEEPGRQ
jgi:hypothetical protein